MVGAPSAIRVCARRGKIQSAGLKLIESHSKLSSSYIQPPIPNLVWKKKIIPFNPAVRNRNEEKEKKNIFFSTQKKIYFSLCIQGIFYIAFTLFNLVLVILVLFFFLLSHIFYYFFLFINFSSFSLFFSRVLCLLQSGLSSSFCCSQLVYMCIRILFAEVSLRTSTL